MKFRSETAFVTVVVHLDERNDFRFQTAVEHEGLFSRAWALSGRRNDGSAPVVVRWSVTSKIGGAGSFNFDVKVPHGAHYSLCELIPDDTWVDISVTMAGREFHLMRGLTRGVTEAFNGEESTFTVSGEGFGRIFSGTKVFFNQYLVDQGSSAPVDALRTQMSLQGSTPAAVVETVLLGGLGWNERERDVNWRMPRSLGGRRFSEAVVVDTTGFANVPNRIMPGFNPQIGEGTLWATATEMSDPYFCELFCDLVPASAPEDSLVGAVARPGDDMAVSSTRMAVLFRNRPFPSVAEGLSSRWFRLPTSEVTWRDVVGGSLGRSGLERYNSFTVGPSLLASLSVASAFLDMVEPIWNLDSIRDHGVLRFDVDTKYLSTEGDIGGVSRALREVARDAYCLNHLFYSGSLRMGSLFPETRIGTRLMLPEQGHRPQMTFYVEEVTHQGSELGNASTTFGVTRGWAGDDRGFVAALREEAGFYTAPTRDDSGAGGAFA